MLRFKNIFSIRPRRILLVSLIFAVFAVYACITTLGRPEIAFNRDVRPIINNKCIACHGGVKKSGGFSLLFREEALGKTKSGKKAIIPGNPDDSELMKRITAHDEDVRMPMGKDPLSDNEISIFRKWIKEGAKWEDHWSFIPPQKITVPDYNDDAFVKNDIDRFILQKHEEQKLEHAPEADKATLIRRLSLDLTGLPPTVAEVDAFLTDQSANSYEKLVDRLLLSPAYGERWAALWLDLARFADTKGYETDDSRNIWRYRDYLIKSFNEDKPYDQFTIEQLAGDLLPGATEDQIIATAFHRNTMSNDEGGTDNEEFRTAAVIDRVNTTFEVWQGITIGCVQCHTHPYDPIRHEEYYNFMAFLNNSRDNDLHEEAPTLVTTADYNIKRADEVIGHLISVTKDKRAVPASIREKRRYYLYPYLTAKDFDTSGNADFNHPTVRLIAPGSYIGYNNIDLSGIDTIGAYYAALSGGIIELRLNKPDGPLLVEFQLNTTYGGFHYIKGGLKKMMKGPHNVYFVLRPGSKDGGEVILRDFKFLLSKKYSTPSKDQKKIDSLKAILLRAINPEGTPVMQDLSDNNKRVTHVFKRGNWTDKGEPVKAAVPQVLNPFPNGAPKNRLGMALWLVAEKNPLTARVAINRFWEQIFGYGIVETLEDFGSQGIRPTHPELLDWLAIKFMTDYKWSMKKLLKLIVMSGTYRQSSVVTSDHLEKDERNRFLARAPRVRLSAEQIRDQALAVGGILSSKMYGPSVMPPQPASVWQMAFNGKVWRVSPGEDAYRRALYTYMKRTSPYPNMLCFDGPSREFSVARRIRTNTPLQALSTLNDTVYTEVAIGLAKRMVNEGEASPASKINAGYKIALAHYPDKEKLQTLLGFYNKAAAFYRKDNNKAVLLTGSKDNAIEIAALTLVASAIINQDEFINKE
jgi:hypothetical protein